MWPIRSQYGISQSCYQAHSLRGQGQGQDFFLKAKDIQIFQGQHQGQLIQLPLQAKICTAVTETEYAYLIKTMQRKSRAALISVSIALSTGYTMKPRIVGYPHLGTPHVG